MNNKSIRPVTILTGFLGSGKTTFLNALLKSQPTTRFAVIENEIGQLNIDSMLLSKSYGQLIALQDGCLCCTLNDELYGSLELLHKEQESFDELLIECTGLAIPGNIIEPFTLHPIFKNYFPLQRIICMVDAVLVEDQIKDRDEVLRQITASDVIIINKTTEVHPNYLTHLFNELSTINPLATILYATSKTKYPFEAIEKVKYKKKNSSFSFLKSINSNSSKIIGGLPFAQQHLTDISTRAYSFEEEFNFIHLFLALNKLVGKYADKIYRMKGICYKTGENKKVILQTVGSRVDMDYGNNWQLEESKYNTFVFIGKELDKLNIEVIFKQILAGKQ